jgi:transposase
VIELHLPPPTSRERLRSWQLREIINAIFYIMHSNCTCRVLHSDFPLSNTVYRWFSACRDAYVLAKLNHGLVMADREHSGRDASRSAAIIGSQSVKNTEVCGPRGYDARKKINGGKRQASVDNNGHHSSSSRIRHAPTLQHRNGGMNFKTDSTG